jgi:hypothetical protein
MAPIGIKPGRIYPRSPPDQPSDLPTTKDDILNLLYHGSRGFISAQLSSLGCGAAPGGSMYLAFTSSAANGLRAADARVPRAVDLGVNIFDQTEKLGQSVTDTGVNLTK